MFLCLTLRTITAVTFFVGLISIPPIFLNDFIHRVIFAAVVGVVSVIGVCVIIVFGVSRPIRKITESLMEGTQLYEKVIIKDSSEVEMSAYKPQNDDFYFVERGEGGIRENVKDGAFDAFSSNMSTCFTNVSNDMEHIGGRFGTKREKLRSGCDSIESTLSILNKHSGCVDPRSNKCDSEGIIEETVDRIINRMSVCTLNTDLYSLQVSARGICEKYFYLLLQQANERKGNNINYTNNKCDDYRLDVSHENMTLESHNHNSLGSPAPDYNVPLMENDDSAHSVLEIPFYLARGKRFKGDKKTICCYIETSKNTDILVYEGIMELQISTDADPFAADSSEFSMTPPSFVFDNRRSSWREPIHLYWIDNTYKGNEFDIKSDVHEVNFFERRLVYGLRQTPIQPPNCIGNDYTSVIRTTRVSVSFVALPSKPMTLVMARCHIAEDPNGTGLSDSSAVWAPALTCTINNVLCVVEKVFLEIIEPKRFWQLPSIGFVDLYGFSLENTDDVTIGALISERVR